MSEIDDLKRDQFLYERDKKIESGGKAFPSHGTMGEVTHEGMTLRQWFAGMALQGALSSGNAEGVEIGRIARESFLMADSMIRAGKGE